MNGEFYMLKEVLNNLTQRRCRWLIVSFTLIIAFAVLSLVQPALQINESPAGADSASTSDTYAEGLSLEDQFIELDSEDEESDEEDAGITEDELTAEGEENPEDQMQDDADTDQEGVENGAEGENTDPAQEPSSGDEQTEDPDPQMNPDDPADDTQNPDEGNTEVTDPEKAAQEKPEGTESAEKPAEKKDTPRAAKQDTAKPVTHNKPVVNTAKTDSGTDAAPARMRLKVTTEDIKSVLAKADNSRSKSVTYYDKTLMDDFQVEFDPEFALVMEQIEDDFEAEHDLITEETLEKRQEQIERGIVFGLDQSSACSKVFDEENPLYLSEQEIELLDRTLNPNKDTDNEAEEEQTEEKEEPLEGQAEIASFHYTNWPDILAIYVSKQFKAGAKKVVFNETSKPALAEIFADMNEVETEDEVKELFSEDDPEEIIEVYPTTWTCRTIEDYMADRFENGTEALKLKELLERYTEPDYLMMCAVQTGSRQLTLAAINAQDEERIEKETEEHADDEEYEAVPLSDQRKSVVLSAQSLNGKIHYFWGGKFNSLGWNAYWATPQIVTSSGCSDYGTEQLYGMDCSGFVSWSFINGLNNIDKGMSLGQGTASQWVTSEAVSDEEAQIGDLVFLRVPSAGSINHVGILIGRDQDGNWLAIHCNAGDDNVAVDRAYDVGFRYLRTPLVYQPDKE